MDGYCAACGQETNTRQQIYAAEDTSPLTLEKILMNDLEQRLRICVSSFLKEGMVTREGEATTKYTVEKGNGSLIFKWQVNIAAGSEIFMSVQMPEKQTNEGK